MSRRRVRLLILCGIAIAWLPIVICLSYLFTLDLKDAERFKL
jgi:hypothetical protein